MKDADYFFDIVFESAEGLSMDANPRGTVSNFILSQVEEKILRESEDMNLAELLELAVCYLGEDYRYIYNGFTVKEEEKGEPPQ
tara:strand:- start:466 stop:717 length:252 start_codon:yes stop_codon:yes gene_type:complete